MSVRTKLRGVVRLANGDDEVRYRLAQRLAQSVHPDAVLGERGRIWLHKDKDFLKAYSHYYPEGLGGRAERLFALYQLVQQSLTIDGDTAECGVWKGAASHLIMQRSAGSQRLHHMFDSWEGISQPGKHDGAFFREKGKGHFAIAEEVARKNLSEFAHGRFYRGWIPARFDEVADRRFCLVYLDVDLYDPTRAALEFFHPRVNQGGLMICDDSGLDKCPGARRAMLEFFASHTREPMIDLPTGQSFIIRS